MIKFSRLAVAAAAALSLQAHALVIDDFTVSQPSAQDSVIGGGGQWTNSTAGNQPSIIGGQRDVFVERVGGVSPSGDGRIFASVPGDGFFRLSQDSDVAGRAILRWDGANTGEDINTSGLGGQNLAAAGNVFIFDFKSDTSNPLAPYDIRIDVYDMQGDLATVEFTTEDTFGTLAPGFFAYDEFTLLGAFSWSDVGAIEVSFNTQPTAAIDVDITIGKVSVVPEPGSIALAGLALLGLGAAGRFRKS